MWLCNVYKSRKYDDPDILKVHRLKKVLCNSYYYSNHEGRDWSNSFCVWGRPIILRSTNDKCWTIDNGC